MKIYSVSQLKKYHGNPPERAGQYILGIKGAGNPDAFCLGNMGEHWFCTHEDDYGIMENYTNLDIDKVLKTYDILKENAEGLPKIEGETQLFVEGDIGGHKLIGYIDVLQGDTIIDIKTSHYLSKPGGNPTMRSGLTKFDEYELQLWFYMKATGKRKAKIVEIAKHDYKKKGEGESRQEIEFNRSDEMDKKRTERSLGLLDSMQQLHDKYGTIHKK